MGNGENEGNREKKGETEGTVEGLSLPIYRGGGGDLKRREKKSFS